MQSYKNVIGHNILYQTRKDTVHKDISLPDSTELKSIFVIRFSYIYSPEVIFSGIPPVKYGIEFHTDYPQSFFVGIDASLSGL
ncbi:MAG: hypothetical protein SNJ71_07255 [Bacteroidales bacterium]